MGMKTVRLDQEAEDALEEIKALTNQPASWALKSGLVALRDRLRADHPDAFEVYSALDLGSGGYSSGAARNSRRLAGDAIKKRNKR